MGDGVVEIPDERMMLGEGAGGTERDGGEGEDVLCRHYKKRIHQRGNEQAQRSSKYSFTAITQLSPRFSQPHPISLVP